MSASFRSSPASASPASTHGSGADAPFDFITALCEAFEDLEPEVENHPFLNELATDQETSALTFAGEGANGEPVYNYAVAKVRMTAPSEVDAEDVGVFFRLFTTASTGFEYRPKILCPGRKRRGRLSGPRPDRRRHRDRPLLRRPARGRRRRAERSAQSQDHRRLGRRVAPLFRLLARHQPGPARSSRKTASRRASRRS